MATILAIDVSVSMMRTVKIKDSKEKYTLLQLAIHGANVLLDYLAVHAKLEFVAVITFSSTCDVLCSFTRDYDLVKSKISQLDFKSNTCYPPVIKALNYLVHNEWSDSVSCQVMMITDGRCYEGLRDPQISPLLFPGNLMVLPLDVTTSIYKNNYDSNRLPNGLGYILTPDLPLTPSSVTKIFDKFAKDTYVPYITSLRCGNLKSDIQIIPPPMAYTRTTDFELLTCCVSNEVHIIGFIESQRLECPATLSRHLVLPQRATDECNENAEISSRTPSFCVLLHGALKVENMTALCQLCPGWLAVLVSWADNKKKSNLMLIILEPGLNPMPWLGDVRHLTLSSSVLTKQELEEPQPIKTDKRSYNQSQLVWIKEAGLQADIQKILRQARKMPEKIQSFYKELNRIRKAAIAYSFTDLLPNIADLLEIECTNLSGSTHPDCAIQLSHVAGELRKPYAMDPKFTIVPLVTKFVHHDLS
ncbi:integrator complex subunit 14 [Daktulosphaira vitifoliae]|uniref:integrator complex subunit 14 n=1 Tax=Daktulosphaira vitifoliae TaxID=58002 RepID=UPI0021AA77A9|nr:integrator complex subunit 14 [Daktulosphaira vitifoliae]